MTNSQRARIYDLAVFLINRPVQFGILKASRLFGDVVHIPAVGYVINDAASAKHILADTTNFSSNGRGGLGYMTTAMTGHLHALINTQGDEHATLKAGLRQLFSEEYITRMVDAAMAELVSSLTADLRNGKTVDLSDYIKRCTSLMTAQMIGLPCDAQKDSTELQDIVRTINKITKYLAVGKIDLSKAELADIAEHYERLGAILRRSYERTSRPDSVIAHLRAIGIEFEHAKSVLTVLLVAGTETVSSSFPRIMALLIDSGQWKVLVAKPELLLSAIDEGLRCTSPAPVILHGSIADSSFKGYQYMRDRRVIVVLHNILHDKRYNDKPHIFNISRQQNPAIKNLWFGYGPHMCLGFFLARKELSASITALMQLGDLQIVKRRVARNTSFPGYRELWIKVMR